MQFYYKTGIFYFEITAGNFNFYLKQFNLCFQFDSHGCGAIQLPATLLQVHPQKHDAV